MLAFPWLVISFGLYNLIVFATPDTGFRVFNEAVANVRMVSGAVWSPTAGEALIAFTVALLFVQMMRSARAPRISVLDRGLSLVLLGACVVEFILRKEAATSIFFMITLAALIDAAAAFTITANRPRKGFTVESAA